MVLISSLYPVRDARSWPDYVHDAWMLLGLALAGPWPGPDWPLAWPCLAMAGSYPGVINGLCSQGAGGVLLS